MTGREGVPWRRLARQLRMPTADGSCDRYLEALPLFVSDEVAGRAVDGLYPAVADHLDVCEACLEAYVGLSRLVRAALAGDGTGA